jgi:hypothetical protein
MPNPISASAAPTIGESNLNYQPPAEVDPAEIQDFEQSLKDIVSEIEDDMVDKPEFTEEELAEGEPEKVEPEVVAPVEDKDDPAVARGMERLISREVSLQQKEAAFQVKEQRFQALEAELASLKTKMPAKDMQEQLPHSPSEVIKSLGHDPATIVRVMIAEQLKAAGKPVPAELQADLDKAENTRRDFATRQEIAGLRAQLEQSKRADEHATFFNTVALGAREYVKTVDSKAMPTLAEIATANPERAHREIMEEITNDARQRAAADPNGQPLTYPEAAKRVEARLSELKGLFGPMNANPKKPAPGKPTAPPQSKPPARPLKPWEKKGDDLYSEGIKAAEREFYRQEELSKRRG